MPEYCTGTGDVSSDVHVGYTEIPVGSYEIPIGSGFALAGPPFGAAETASPATLVQVALGGDRRAWHELLERFGAVIASVGRRHGLAEVDVAGLQQTTWLCLVEDFDPTHQAGEVGDWLMMTARRETLRLLRRSGTDTPSSELAR